MEHCSIVVRPDMPSPTAINLRHNGTTSSAWPQSFLTGSVEMRDMGVVGLHGVSSLASGAPPHAAAQRQRRWRPARRHQARKVKVSNNEPMHTGHTVAASKVCPDAASAAQFRQQHLHNTVHQKAVDLCRAPQARLPRWQQRENP